MKIQYMSDLHLEFAPLDVEPLGDVLVLAGDIVSGEPKSRERLEDMLSLRGPAFEAIILVIGNHEGYHTGFGEAMHYLSSLKLKYPNFYFLNRDSVTVRGITFHGCGLWSDPGQTAGSIGFDAEMQARRRINDYRLIKGWDYERHIEEHKKDVEWLNKVICPNDVVVTHFPPIRNAASPASYRGQALNYWYCNDLTDLIESTRPAVWISGHTHHTWEELVGVTKVLGNCRGYYNPYSGNEVTDFNPAAIIEV